MKPVSAPLYGLFPLSVGAVIYLGTIAPVHAQKALTLVYPPPNHETTASKIFLIGSAPPKGQVMVNGQVIDRSPAGHFAPSFPLQMGLNRFTLNYGKQAVNLTVNRLPSEPGVPATLAFIPNSLSPAVDIARQPNEWFCFAAIASPGATVAVNLAGQTIPLLPQAQNVALPPNLAVLTLQNQPVSRSAIGHYQGCTRTVLLGDLGKPEFQLTRNGQTVSQVGTGSIRILSPGQFEVAEVTAENGTARTGPSTDYSRLTPLPRGTRAAVTGYEGEWVRLDYGAWIRRSEVQIQKGTPPSSIIRSIKARQVDDWTEVVFPLQVPVPVSVQQGDRTFTLTLYNTTAQTDIIKLDDDPLIARLDWQQVMPGQVQYTFNLKTNQQWGYKLRYEGTSLVLSFKHPPPMMKGEGVRGASLSSPSSLSGITILLDPGHGGPEDLGARGPTGLPEKNVALKTSQLLRDELQRRGARVVMTREKDADVTLQDRVKLINKVQPTIALSLHYNALPDDGDAIKTQGLAAFWYNTQAHSLAMFLHNYLTRTLKRPSYGVFWNNLALTRPTVTPAVMLELGFMINPIEYEWIASAKEQKKLAGAIADGITAWFRTR